MMQEPLDQARSGLPIDFAGLLVVVGGGTLDIGLLSRLAPGAHLVGADGGGDAIGAAGLVPDAIIGDLDSLIDPDDWPKTRVIRIVEQETTDFEKVLYSTRAPVTVALGMTGSRFDHTLTALDAVMRHAHERAVILVDEDDIALAVSGPFDFAVAPGDRVSVYPLAPVRFAHSQGLIYPLDGLELAQGARTGTSNVASDGPFTITPASGDATPWLLILARRHLDALIEKYLVA